MSLAAKLPYDHPYAGGYPGIGSQPLPSDGDALTYLASVADADGAGVEVGVANAVDAFVRGCKADGVWAAIKASCILAGARTLSGALVPLVGTAPTNVADGFVSGDYTRGGATPGLKGDGTSYLDSGRADNAGPQDDFHLSVYATTHHTRTAATKSDIGCNSDSNSLSHIVTTSTTRFFRCRSTPVGGFAETTSLPGFQGLSRSAASEYVGRYNQTAYPVTATSSPPPSDNIFVFARNIIGTADSISDARLAFYSIGESLDLAALDTHVTNLVTNIGAAL